MSAIDDIKARIDIVDLVSETVKLRRSGKNYVGFCPFHDNRKTPAFAVFPESGSWRCFGQCNEGGDVFRFVMKKEGWDFAEALNYLAARAGVVLEPLTPEKEAKDKHKDLLHGLLEEAVLFYKHHLFNSNHGKTTLEYLKQRGVKHETIDLFGLGYAPASWDAFTKHFIDKGYSQEDLVNAGMVSQKEDGSSVYDRFRNRLMFPIRNSYGKMVGFGARALDPDDNPKYLNSPQSELFDKGRLLFGLNLAKKNIRTKDQVIIVEGYMDVIVPYQEGYQNIVSPMGTAISPDQLRYIKKMTRNIVFALDPDPAGQKATIRGLEVARETIERTIDPIADIKGKVDYKGLVKHESRLNLDLRVASLPENKDPDEIVLQDPESFGKIIDSAQPIVVHIMESLVAARDISIPKVKDQIASYVLLLIEDVQSQIERDAYRQRLARLLKLDERTLLSLKSTRKKPKRYGKREPVRSKSVKPEIVQKSNSDLTLALEDHLLGILLRDPEMIYSLDRDLVKAELERFSVNDFEHTDNKTIATIIINSINQDEKESSVYIADNVQGVFSSKYDLLIESIAGEESKITQLKEDLTRTLIRLRQVRITERIEQLRSLQEENQQSGMMVSGQIQERFVQYIKEINVLNKSLTKPISLD